MPMYEIECYTPLLFYINLKNKFYLNLYMFLTNILGLYIKSVRNNNVLHELHFYVTFIMHRANGKYLIIVYFY